MADLDLEQMQELYQELEGLLAKKLGSNKYILLVSYQQSEDNEVDSMTHTITNMDGNSPLYAWRAILKGLNEKVEDLNNYLHA